MDDEKVKKPFNPLLYLVTDPELSLGRSEEEVVQRAVAAGVTMVQYRDKGTSTRVMVEKTRALVSICRGAGVPLVVNDRLDVALAGGADGVHLGQDDMNCTDARRIAGEPFIIGVSVTSALEIEKAEKAGADYVAANGVFLTGTKTDLGEPLGLDGLAKLAAVTKLPLVGIGGIDDTNAGQVIEAGGAGVAIVSYIVSADDIEARCRVLLQAMESARTKY
jgi:thiamine-phosphate pyrophosphorylase